MEAAALTLTLTFTLTLALALALALTRWKPLQRDTRPDVELAIEAVHVHVNNNDRGANMVSPQGQSGPLAAPPLGSCASSGRAWRLWAARRSQAEAGPLGAQPLPRLLELAASKAADVPTSDHPGVPRDA